jgi:hypothetical protein
MTHATDGSHQHYTALGREILSGLLDRHSITSLRSDSPPLEDDEMVAIREIASRHSGQPLSLDPIVMELVRALVVRWYAPGLTDKAMHGQWNFIADQIAASLYEDPVARERLQLFWSRLTGT